MAEVSVSKAARMTGKGRSTIQRHMKEGKLSFGRDAAGNPVIDVSELIRVYGSIKAGEADRVGSTKQSDALETGQVAQTIEALREELRAAKEREDWLKRQLEAAQEHGRDLEIRLLSAASEPMPDKIQFFRAMDIEKILEKRKKGIGLTQDEYDFWQEERSRRGFFWRLFH